MKDGGDEGALDDDEVDEEEAAGDGSSGGVIEEGDDEGGDDGVGEVVTTGSATVRGRCTGVRGGATSGNEISMGK